MNGPMHFHKAELWMQHATDSSAALSAPEIQAALHCAHIHATLAGVAAQVDLSADYVTVETRARWKAVIDNA